MEDAQTHSRLALQNRRQLALISDLDALKDVAEAIELAITKIETDLEFRDDEEWQARARGALGRHRFALRLVKRREWEVRSALPRNAAPQRSPNENDARTNACLEQRPEIDFRALKTVEDADAAFAHISAHLHAVSDNRDDEIALPAGDRDEGFLAKTGGLIRHLKMLRQQIQNRRGELARAAKAAELRRQEAVRERLFIQAARQLLDKETYQRLWAWVDQEQRYGASVEHVEEQQA